MHPAVKGLIAVGGPEIPGIALCAYVADSLTVLHVEPVEFSVFSLAWCTGEDSSVWPLEALTRLHIYYSHLAGLLPHPSRMSLTYVWMFPPASSTSSQWTMTKKDVEDD